MHLDKACLIYVFSRCVTHLDTPCVVDMIHFQIHHSSCVTHPDMLFKRCVTHPDMLFKRCVTHPDMLFKRCVTHPNMLFKRCVTHSDTSCLVDVLHI